MTEIQADVIIQLLILTLEIVSVLIGIVSGILVARGY